MNEDAEKLGINGVYELIYDEYVGNGHNTRKHRYVRLKAPTSALQKAVVIAQQFNVSSNTGEADAGHNWKILYCDVNPTVGLTTTLVTPIDESSCQEFLSSANVKSNCPIEAGGWTITDIANSPNSDTAAGTNNPASLANGNVADIRVSCSTTRNKCPELNPFSFHWGQYCCSSPFFHYGYATAEATNSNPHQPAEVLSPDHECRTADGYTVSETSGTFPDCEASRDTDGQRGCLGTVVRCPTTNPAKYPCRSNLAAKAAKTQEELVDWQFKGLFDLFNN